MQTLWRPFYSQLARRSLLPLIAARPFADLQVNQQQALDPVQQNARLGVDMQFNEQKHAYVLTFPWNFNEIIRDFENDYRGMSPGSFWHRFVMNNATYNFNALFREFHQHCSMPDYENIDKICEGKLAQYVKESVRRIHFHGLDIEMANLTVEQPKIKLLKVEVHHGLSVERSQNKPPSAYKITKNSLLGAPQTVYVPKEDSRHFLDHLDSNYKPYVVAATVLIESPMKLYVQNQNFSAVLFGSTDEEQVKNVVRFETNVRALDLFKIVGVNNKPQFDWKITDFNNVLNENPYLPQY